MHELHKDDTHKPQMYRPEITSKRSASAFHGSGALAVKRRSAGRKAPALPTHVLALRPHP